jgi:twitching motility protein PilI
VECQSQGLLFPLAGAGEIFAVPPLLPVPHTRDWFLGVSNLRGRLHGVVDLAAFLGLRTPLAAGAAPLEQGRVLALNPALGSHCALLIDRLAGLRARPQMQALDAPDGARPSFAGGVWADDAGRQWQELDLAALAAHPRFLGIAA